MRTASNKALELLLKIVLAIIVAMILNIGCKKDERLVRYAGSYVDRGFISSSNKRRILELGENGEFSIKIEGEEGTQNTGTWKIENLRDIVLRKSTSDNLPVETYRDVERRTGMRSRNRYLIDDMVLKIKDDEKSLYEDDSSGKTVWEKIR